MVVVLAFALSVFAGMGGEAPQVGEAGSPVLVVQVSGASGVLS